MNHQQNNQILSGRERAWSTLDKLGEGDAGEVYLVESLLEKERAILKRPHRDAFTSDKLRQATQIEREAQTLRVLRNLEDFPTNLHIPRLLDQSKVGVDQYERFFIVISVAPGFDLRYLARTRRFNQTLESPGFDNDPIFRAYINRFENLNQFSKLILLRSIRATLLLLNKIHNFEFRIKNGAHHGIMWNDFKPEHIYWDPIKNRITIIDWGNAQFLDEKGITADRQHSRLDDYMQLISEMGSFLRSECPELINTLDWPDEIDYSNASLSAIETLSEHLEATIDDELLSLKQVRENEARLLLEGNPGFEDYQALDSLHTQLIGFGELPDYPTAAKFIQRIGRRLVETGEITQFQHLCHESSDIPTLNPEEWSLLERISNLSIHEPTANLALKAGLKPDWPSALWELRRAAQDEPEPAWWDSLKSGIRQLYLGTSPEALSPYVALCRLVHTLRALVEDHNSASMNDLDETILEKIDILRHELKEILQHRWVMYEPDPPKAGLAYWESEGYLLRIQDLLPDAGRSFEISLTQPNAQVDIILDAWERQDFETAQRGLRTLLIWDPDRKRVLSADEAIERAPNWLQEVIAGPGDETRLDFVTRLELEGRSIRQRVSPAAWLDSILEAFKALRKGDEPADVMLAHPELRDVTGWLLELEPNRPLLASTERTVLLSRISVDIGNPSLIEGRAETLLGEDGDAMLAMPIDAWAPEARGSSARVFSGHFRDMNGDMREVAIKLMRPGRSDYALPLFKEELLVLQSLHDTPGLSRMLECGFIRLEAGQELPPEDKKTTAYNLTGDVRRFGLNASRHFLAELSQRTNNGWLPYLALDLLENKDNLLLSCDASYTHGRLLPILNGLVIAIQILEILATAHSRGVVYRDHKILHYYWQDSINSVFVIDWNIAKLHNTGIPNGEVQFDLVQFSARALHHILTGRPAPGALPLGPNRPEEIAAASRSYSVQWTYDDQRLPQSLKEILERALAGEYQSATQLSVELAEIYHKLSRLLQS